MFQIIIPIIIIALDQASKAFVSTFPQNHPIALIPNVVSLYNVSNTGALFGLMQNYNNLLTVISAIIICSLIVYLFMHRSEKTLFQWALLLILSGAIGNVIDRLWHNSVIDFIKLDFIDFPVFNVADISICIGACLLIWSLVKEEKE